MKIIVKNNNFNIDTWLDNRLMDIGVYNKDAFIGLNEFCIEPAKHYDNMDKGLELLDKSSTRGILIDCDPDGYTSAAIMYEYCNRINKPIDNIFFHQGKQHGLEDTYKEILASGIDLLIVPDAGSNDYEYHKILKDKGVNVLILDHHESKKYSEDAIVINNQLSKNVKNKNLSGVGVTYKFIEYCNIEKYKVKYSDLLDLVALGNISDMMDISEDETRYLCIEGLDDINNRFFKAMINKFINGDVNMKSISWNITPKINAIIRNGTFEEKKLLFEAFINPTKKIEIEKKGKKSKINMSTHIVDMCDRIKRNQDTKVKNGVQEFISRGKVDIDKKAIIIMVDDEIDKGITGLVANKLLGEYKRPIIILHLRENGLYGGSARSPKNFGGIDNFKDYLCETGLIELGEGHGNAFGIEIKECNIESLKLKLEEEFKDVEIDELVVDYEIKAVDLTNNHIEEVAQYKHLWGRGLEEPKFIIKNVEIESDYINMMFNKTILTFAYSGIYYNKKYCSKVFREDLGYENEENIKTRCDIIATFDVEEYKGNKYYKVIIDKLIKH